MQITVRCSWADDSQHQHVVGRSSHWYPCRWSQLCGGCAPSSHRPQQSHPFPALPEPNTSQTSAPWAASLSLLCCFDIEIAWKHMQCCWCGVRLQMAACELLPCTMQSTKGWLKELSSVNSLSIRLCCSSGLPWVRTCATVGRSFSGLSMVCRLQHLPYSKRFAETPWPHVHARTPLRLWYRGPFDWDANTMFSEAYAGVMTRSQWADDKAAMLCMLQINLMNSLISR